MTGSSTDEKVEQEKNKPFKGVLGHPRELEEWKADLLKANQQKLVLKDGIPIRVHFPEGLIIEEEMPIVVGGIE